MRSRRTCVRAVQGAVDEEEDQARQMAGGKARARRASTAPSAARKASSSRKACAPGKRASVILLSLGMPTGQAYIEAGYLRKDGKIPDGREAMHHGCRLLHEPKVKAYYAIAAGDRLSRERPELGREALILGGHRADANRTRGHQRQAGPRRPLQGWRDG